MFNRTSIRILIFFSTALLTVGTILAVLFSKLVVQYQETALLDSLSAQIQIAATKADLSDESESFFLPDGSTKGDFFGFFDGEIIREQLPPSGTLVFQCKDRAKQDHLCAVAQMKNNGWVVRATRAPGLSTVLSSLARELMGSIFILLIFSVALVFLMSRFLSLPLKKLAAATKLISDGQYDHVVLPDERFDEVGDLARAFRKMIDEIQKREKYLKDAGSKIAHTSRLATIGQMGASIAHEVKNPLMALHGHARLLQQKVKDQELAEVAEILVSESDRCNQILQQMLRYSRSEDGAKKPYAIMDVIRSSIKLVLAEAKKRRIEINFDSKTETILSGNAQQVQQVFLNILINAIQASPENSKILVTAEELGNRLVLKVRDAGPGIPESIQAKIFDPFFTTKDKREGSGLGLSIAATLIAEEDGHISFETSSKGTCFEISLPIPLAKSA